MQAPRVSFRFRPIPVILAASTLACLAAPPARAGRVASASASTGETVAAAATAPLGQDVLPALLHSDGPRPDVPRVTRSRQGEPPKWVSHATLDGAGDLIFATDAPVLAGETIAGEARRASLLPPEAGHGSIDDVASHTAVGVDNVVAPLPPAALTGLPALAGLWAVRQWRRLRRGA